ncbi:MAG: 16S rRNA (guanine(527)-N(7))-methyltransferase RsmG [Dehalococcoidia bacterium]
MDWLELPDLFPAIPSPGTWLPLLQRHHDLLEAAAVRVSSVPPEEVVRRHYAEALETWRIATAEEMPSRIADVGSGGGFPGIVFAIIAPDAHVDLVEPLRKRATLLSELVARLALTNVTVYPQRAEEAGRGPLREAADLGTARAVASLSELLEYVAPLVRPEGLIAFPKGSGLRGELGAAASALKPLRCEVIDTVSMRPEVSETISILRLRRTGEMPGTYPRRAGIPAKRPL